MKNPDTTIITARRLNGTDIGKTITTPQITGTLASISHALRPGTTSKDANNLKPIVIVNIDNNVLQLQPGTRVELTKKSAKPQQPKATPLTARRTIKLVPINPKQITQHLHSIDPNQVTQHLNSLDTAEETQ